jgi:BirA family biotin operon repressor/biotin-[acetyl-CoA-carboxylase] ligase
LASHSAATGTRRIACDTIGSTNAHALELARGGETGPLWVTARRQTAGRGRRGRVWTSEAGNLYATLLLTDPAPAEHAAQLSFVAALAAHDAVAETVAGAAPQLGPLLQLKWPNDLLLGGAKIGGLLLEGEGAERRLSVAVGIGLNCLHHPDDTPYPATDLAAAGASVTPEALFTALARAMHLRLAQWDRGAGFAAIRAAWLARAAHRGEDIVVRTGERDMTGRFEALDDIGRLLLRRPDGTLEPITAGDVFPLPRAGAAAFATGAGR